MVNYEIFVFETFSSSETVVNTRYFMYIKSMFSARPGGGSKPRCRASDFPIFFATHKIYMYIYTWTPTRLLYPACAAM